MNTVTSADGTTIVYETIGIGPPLLLLHGTGRDRSHWGQAIPELASNFTVHAISRRGRGGSGDGAGYSIEQEANDVDALVDAIGEPVHLLGHSYGGIVALEAAKGSLGLRSLILYEPPIPAGPGGVPDDLGIRLEAMLAQGDREGVFVTFLREGPRYSEDVITEQRRRADWRERLDYAHTLPRETQSVRAHEFDRQSVAEVTVPTLLLLGSESPAFFRAAIEALHSALPDSEIELLEGQRHIAMETAPVLFADSVHAFLARHER